MSDNKKKPGSPDNKLVSRTEGYELRDWAKKFGVTQKELAAVVKKVGPSAKAIESELKKGK